MLEDIAGYLAAEGLGTLGTDLFLGLLPDQPDSCVALYAYPGRPPAWEHDGPQPALRYPRLQVLTRDPSYVAAESLARDASAALCALVNRPLGATTYGRVTPLQEPFPLERDASGRVLFTCNYEITILS